MAACGVGNAAEQNPAGAPGAWTQHRDAVLKDASLVRYYTFEQVSDAATPIPSLKGEEAALRFVNAPADQFRVVEGRWPGKKAVRLDRGALAAEPFEVSGKSFTVEAWFRTNGLGSLHGDAIPTGGTLFSAGIGYWDGWRVTLLYPDQVLGFEIGRPQPVNAVSVRAAEPVPDGVWHHLAATWDGKQMRLYVDGLLLVGGEYAGDYYPPKPGSQFRLGFAGFGWGSAVLDVDEVAVYSRALNADEVLRNAYFEAPLTESLVTAFGAANQAFDAQDFGAAADSYGRLLKLPDVHPHLLGLARLRLAQCLRQQQQVREAVDQFAKVEESPDATDTQRRGALAQLLQLLRQGAGDSAPPSLCERILAMPALSPEDKKSARLSLARGYANAGNSAAARDQYAKLLDLPDASPRNRLNVRLELAHTCLAAKEYAAARSEYGRIVAQADAPVQYKVNAQLRIAESYVREKKLGEAKAAFAKVAAIPDVPAHLRWEAEERAQEVDRLQAGLPARDPMRSRTQLPQPRPAGIELYVAPNGSDTGPGTKERPFATLGRARDAVRALKQKGALPDGGVTLHLREGEYRLGETFQLTEEDSGTAQTPIVYRAYQGEQARVTGGVQVQGFEPVRDAAILARLPEEARGKVLQLDLKANGITQFGELKPHGFGSDGQPIMELFFDGKPMQPARWPNEGFVQTGKVTDPKSTFEYQGDRPKRWGQARDVWMYGYWYWLWADAALGVDSIDTNTRRLKAKFTPNYGIREGQPYFYYNLLEEIDVPGEWYLDRAAGILYFYPPADPAKATVQLSLLDAPLVQMDGVSQVTLLGLAFELGRGTGIEINGGDHCLVAGCTVRKLGGDAVILNGGTNHGVLGCDLHTLGRGGTRVAGGDRKTLTPGGHFVENCHVYDFSRLDRTYTPAVHMDGCGNRIAHNLFHHTPCHAMRIEGNDHVIEFNEVHHVVLESDDQGGVDMFYNPGYRGNLIRYNYWHDIKSAVPLGQAAIRLDDAICGTLIYGNVFARCSNGLFGAVQIHGGKDNWVDNNLFLDCRYGISFSGWGPDRWKATLARPEIVKKLSEEVDITKPPYSTRYPELARLGEGEGINNVWRSVVYNCGEFLTRDRGLQDLMDNYVTSQDPGFADALKGDFRLRDDSPVYDRIGFRTIPFEEIGLYEDEYRASPSTGSEVGKRR
jgi:thioredoxin-like negative regulator of GroEL